MYPLVIFVLLLILLEGVKAQNSENLRIDQTMITAHIAGISIPQFPLHEIPPLLEARLVKSRLAWSDIPGLVQLATLYNTGYVFDRKMQLLPYYTKCNSSSAAVQLSPAIVAAACNTTEFQRCHRDLRLLDCPSGNLSQSLQCAVAASVNDNITEQVGRAYIALNSLPNRPPQVRNGVPYPQAVRRRLGEEEFIVITLAERDQLPECNATEWRGPVAAFPCNEYDPQDQTYCPPVQENFIERILDGLREEILEKERDKESDAPRIVEEARPSKQRNLWIFIIAGVVILGGLLMLSVYCKRRRLVDLREGLLGRDSSLVFSTVCFGSTGPQKQWLTQVKALGIKFITADEITLMGKIGEGSYSEVFLAKFSGIKVAIKKAMPWQPPGAVMGFTDEIILGSSLVHPNILQFIGIASLPTMGVCLVSEYMELGDLLVVLENDKNNLSWQDRKLDIAMDCAAGLTYLHNLDIQILHRDLKSRNILLNEHFRAKLADFGLASPLTTATQTIAGSYLWLAPEILHGEKYSAKSDIYSFGIILSELATRALPYATQQYQNGTKLTSLAIAGLAANEGLRPSLPEDTPVTIVQVFQHCVHPDPILRLSASQLLERLHQARVEM